MAGFIEGVDRGQTVLFWIRWKIGSPRTVWSESLIFPLLRLICRAWGWRVQLPRGLVGPATILTAKMTQLPSNDALRNTEKSCRAPRD